MFKVLVKMAELQYCGVVFILVAIITSGNCQKITFSQCSGDVCAPTDNVDDPASSDWSVQVEDFMFFHSSSDQMITLVDIRKQLGVTFSQTHNLFFVANADNNALLVTHKRRTYFVRSDKVFISYKNPQELVKTVSGLVQEVIMPHLKEVEVTKKKEMEEGFGLRELLVYLRVHKDIKGAPCLHHRSKLTNDLEKYFGKVFKQLKEFWEDGVMAVNDYEGCFLRLSLGKNPNDDEYYKYFAGILAYNIKVEGTVAETIYRSYKDGSVDDIVAQTPVFAAAPDLYTSSAEALSALSKGTFEHRKNKVDQLTICVYQDTDTKISAISIASHDGQVDLVIIYYPSSASWFFACRITTEILAFTEGPNYSIYNLWEGVGIIVCRKSGHAQIVDEKADQIRGYYIQHQTYQGLAEIADITSKFKVKKRFNFGNLLHHAYYTGSVMFMNAGLSCKMQLNKHFEEFIKGFQFVKGYEGKEGEANVVLYWFKGVCLKGVKEDYRGIVKVVGVKESMFGCSAVLSAATTCSIDKLLKLK